MKDGNGNRRKEGRNGSEGTEKEGGGYVYCLPTKGEKTPLRKELHITTTAERLVRLGRWGSKTVGWGM